MPSIGAYIKLNQIQTRTNLGHKPEWKKWRQIQNVGHSTDIIWQIKTKGPIHEMHAFKSFFIRSL